MTEVPTTPLFLQNGTYPARADRVLIGALLSPSGDEAQGAPNRPLAGVRPAGLVEGTVSGQFSDRSFQVTISGTNVVVAPGAAFIPSGTLTGLSAIYLVSSDVPKTIKIPSPVASTQVYRIYIVVYDPEDTPGGGGPTSVMWDIVILSQGSAAPPTSLALATVTVPASGAATTGDLRQYTTGLGGIYVAPSLADLTGRRMPLGTLAFIRGANVFWVREAATWKQVPVIVSTDTTNYTPRFGELRWNNALGILEIGYQKGTPATIAWGQIGNLPHQARSGYQTSWNETQRVANSLRPVGFWTLITADGGYYPINDNRLLTIDGKTDQPEDRRDAEVQVKINSRAGVLQLELCAKVTVRKNDKTNDYPVDDTGIQGHIIIASERRIIPKEDEEPIESVDGEDPPEPQYVFPLDLTSLGLYWVGNQDGQKCKFAVFELPPGEYIFRPVFGVTADAVLEIESVNLRVAVYG